METVNFNDAFYKANLLYGIDDNFDTLEELALIAWDKIDAPLIKTYRIVAQMDKDSLTFELPCNCKELLAVTMCKEDWIKTNSISITPNYRMKYYEEYNESIKRNTDPMYIPGEYIKHQLSNGILYFTDYYPAIRILYNGAITDENGLPLITEKQSFAIATFIAWTKNYKEGLLTRNGNIIQIAEMLERKWRTAAAQSRITGKLSQNDLDRVLNVASSWNRKSFNKSFKIFQQ